MKYRGLFRDGTTTDMCDTAWELYRAWLKTPTPDSDTGDPFDNDEGRAYWQHRDACPECTPRKVKQNDKQ